MSLCNTCGLDLETGQRIDLAEDLEPVSTGSLSQGTPASILILGMLILAATVVLSIAALIGWQKGQTGAEFLLLIGLFGVYAAVAFLRRRSIKLLFVALTLGVMIDVVAMIAIPVFIAVSDVEVVNTRDADEEAAAIKPITEKLDINRVTWGIALVLAYAAVSVYLFSPPIRRHFERR